MKANVLIFDTMTQFRAACALSLIERCELLRSFFPDYLHVLTYFIIESVKNQNFFYVSNTVTLLNF